MSHPKAWGCWDSEREWGIPHLRGAPQCSVLFDITAALLAERVKMCGSDARTSEEGNLSRDFQESSVMEQKRKRGIRSEE